MNLLFVCSRNLQRSPTAEALFQGRDGHRARSAGTSPSARIRVTEGLLRWADVVFVMEHRHRAQLRARFGDLLDGVRIECLHIPDDFERDDPDLIGLLESSVPRYLTEPDPEPIPDQG